MLNVRVDFANLGSSLSKRKFFLNVDIISSVYVFYHFLFDTSKVFQDFLETWPFILIKNQHFFCQNGPLFVQLFRILDPSLLIFKVIHFLNQLLLRSYMSKKLCTHEHFVEYSSCTPNIAFLIIFLFLVYFRSCIQRGACSFGHLMVNISCKSKICNFDLCVLVQENVVWLQISMTFI